VEVPSSAGSLCGQEVLRRGNPALHLLGYYACEPETYADLRQLPSRVQRLSNRQHDGGIREEEEIVMMMEDKVRMVHVRRLTARVRVDPAWANPEHP
jgi:hypothetical protein